MSKEEIDTLSYDELDTYIEAIRLREKYEQLRDLESMAFLDLPKEGRKNLAAKAKKLQNEINMGLGINTITPDKEQIEKTRSWRHSIKFFHPDKDTN